MSLNENSQTMTKLNFAESPADYTVYFNVKVSDKKSFKLTIGNLAAYGYNEIQQKVAKNVFGGGANPSVMFSGKKSVTGVVVFHTFNTDFESDLAFILNKIKTEIDSTSLVLLKKTILGKSNDGYSISDNVKPEDISIDDLPDIDIELIGKKTIEKIIGVSFNTDESGLGISQLGVNRKLGFGATRVEKLKKNSNT